MQTLIIDNYDSFTFNLVHAVASITGAMPIVVRNDEKTWAEAELLEFDHVIISPGPGRPDRVRDFGISMDAIRRAQVPVLGICLGHQGIAAAFGGAVVQAEPVHGYLAEVIHRGDDLFAGIPERFHAVRYHSLVVSEPLPPELQSIAWTSDGTVMALRHVSRPLWGVQFHPESILTEHGSALLRNFLGATGGSACRASDLFRQEFASEPYAFWLDNWDGRTYMGCGSPASPDSPGFRAGYFTYEGQPVFIKAERLLITHVEQALPPAHRSAPPRNVRYRIPKAEYLDRIRQCLHLIRAGESYEMCLTNQLLLETDLPALDYYENLRRINPAPYAAYLQFGDTQIACSSPERFLKIDKHGRVESRPIKGTIARDHDPSELTSNERFRAENLMIVDLVRHDLSRVCEVGSVKVPRLMEVETYPTVHQLVSTITGQLSPGKTALDCVQAAFPGGSMTGAPKKRTMELLAQLEGAPRGIYSGSLGYFDEDGSADLNIVIRTAVFLNSQVTIGTGGAIVAQSDPEAEWDEIELKAQALLRAFDGE